MSDRPHPPHPVPTDPAHKDDEAVKNGDTRAEQDGDPAPRLPHEHDQSADSQSPTDGQPTRVGRQAHEDVERGLQDTDRGPVMDKLRRKLAP
ncbi:hypothetical protein PGB34_20355 [Xenophilus arseniciresistens]|uniref:Uncharacterized protein n=1 Tax=Xenophilus arseniciresistens TaxID=1283306 RepID=A0AAE3T2S6_9BURK|nr:hypothetical protein [Xenophilus arseniciresistens]MDA7418732.1 hypothetical protein [Xenophilus arseniciresistens]